MKTVFFNEQDCEVKIRVYSNERPLITLHDKETGFQVARATINIKTRINKHLAFIKNWNENEGIYQALLKAKIIKASLKKIEVGFEEAFICELNVCQICDNNIHIPRVCKNCAEKNT